MHILPHIVQVYATTKFKIQNIHSRLKNFYLRKHINQNEKAIINAINNIQYIWQVMHMSSAPLGLQSIQPTDATTPPPPPTPWYPWHCYHMSWRAMPTFRISFSLANFVSILLNMDSFMFPKWPISNLSQLTWSVLGAMLPQIISGPFY